MCKKKVKDANFKIYCCFSNDKFDVEKTIGLIFIDYIKQKNKRNLELFEK